MTLTEEEKKEDKFPPKQVEDCMKMSSISRQVSERRMASGLTGSAG